MSSPVGKHALSLEIWYAVPVWPLPLCHSTYLPIQWSDATYVASIHVSRGLIHQLVPSYQTWTVSLLSFCSKKSVCIWVLHKVMLSEGQRANCLNWPVHDIILVMFSHSKQKIGALSVSLLFDLVLLALFGSCYSRILQWWIEQLYLLYTLIRSLYFLNRNLLSYHFIFNDHLVQTVLSWL